MAMPNKLIRVGLHAELMKFGRIPDPRKPALADQLSTQDALSAARSARISEVGYDLSFGESRALFAVQALLDATDYKGNQPPMQLPSGNGYQFAMDLPWLKVPVSDYLSAYGVSKKKSARGKAEFTSGGREAALEGLRCLADKPRLHAYDRRIFENGRVINIRVEAVAPIIKLEQLNGEVTITPCPVLVDQIETYFVWKPADLYTKVLDGKDRTKALFIEQLLYLFEMNRREAQGGVYLVKRQLEAMAYALRMDALLDARQEKRIRTRLSKLYEFGKQIGYLKDYEVDVPGAKVAKLDRLHLNSATFRDMRKAPLQISQGLPAKVAKSTSNGSSDIKIDEEYQCEN
jgi:hypothetical protein